MEEFGGLERLLWTVFIFGGYGSFDGCVMKTGMMSVLAV